MKNKGFVSRFLKFIESTGNKLPPPAILFLLLTIMIIVASAIFAWMGLKVLDPRVEDGEAYLTVFNLLSAEGIRYLFSSVVTNYTSFAPLGSVLVAYIGISIAEHSGLISASIRAMIARSNKVTVTALIVFAGIMSNVAGDFGYIIIIPLAGAIFHSMGRHPIAGMAAGFAGVSGGYSANLLIGALDPLLGGLSQKAAQMLDPSCYVGPEVNWYFMIVSTFFVTANITLLSEKVVEPSLGKYEGGNHLDEDEESLKGRLKISKQEKKA